MECNFDERLLRLHLPVKKINVMGHPSPFLQIILKVWWLFKEKK